MNVPGIMAGSRPMMVAMGGILLINGLVHTTAYGDGGVVRAVERHGNYQISVFTSPNPLVAGPIDVSVLIQDAATSQPVATGPMTVMLAPRDRPDARINAPATREAATNKLFHAALIELPEPGWWDVEVTCPIDGDHARLRFAMESGAPGPGLPALWPWYSWPMAVVLIFGMHQWLIERGRR